MKVHLVDGTYELFRAHYGAPPARGRTKAEGAAPFGNRLIHKINDLVTVDLTDNQVEKRSMSGLLALQLHAGDPMLVQFRNIRLTPLK